MYIIFSRKLKKINFIYIKTLNKIIIINININKYCFSYTFKYIIIYFNFSNKLLIITKNLRSKDIILPIYAT